MLCLWLSTPAFNDWNILLQYSDEFTVEFLSLFHLFFNLDLYLLGDDTSISQGSFTQTKHHLS